MAQLLAWCKRQSSGFVKLPRFDLSLPTIDLKTQINTGTGPWPLDYWFSKPLLCIQHTVHRWNHWPKFHTIAKTFIYLFLNEKKTWLMKVQFHVYSAGERIQYVNRLLNCMKFSQQTTKVSVFWVQLATECSNLPVIADVWESASSQPWWT